MHISETVQTMEVAKTFIESLGGSGLHDRFIPGPTTVEISSSKGHPLVRLDYHISSLPDPDAAAVVAALSALEAVHWSSGTVPYGITEIDGVKINIEIYVPSPPREPLLREALINAGWSSVAGVG